MSNKIDWSKLSKIRTVKKVTTTYEEKQLPEGVYACPQCEGSGRVMTVHSMFGPHQYGKCGMCNGTGEIIKCETCNTNPVPNNANWYFYPICHDCHNIKIKKLIAENDKMKYHGGRIESNKTDLKHEVMMADVNHYLKKLTAVDLSSKEEIK